MGAEFVAFESNNKDPCLAKVKHYRLHKSPDSNSFPDTIFVFPDKLSSYLTEQEKGHIIKCGKGQD